MSAAFDNVIHLPRVQRASECLRPTRAEVDLSALAHNLGVIRDAAHGSAVLAVVKADAYGHGVVPVAKRLAREGVHGFGVALAEEGLELRAAGIASEIIVLNGVIGGAHAEVIDAGLVPVVYELDELQRFHAAARGPFRVHVKVDTGMSRLGVPMAQLDDFLEGLRRLPNVRVDGLMTHLACADSDDTFTAAQLRSFHRAVARFRAKGHIPRWLHAANSAALFRHPASRFDLVRPGVALFGHAGAGDVDAGLAPVLRLRSEIVSLRDVPTGGQVGYAHGFVAERPTRVATVPLGYGDGLLRAVSGRGQALVGGHRVPIIGNVSMDLTTLDVTRVPATALGDEVVFLGGQGEGRIDAAELARWAGTIPYEVLTNISRRVPRFYRE